MDEKLLGSKYDLIQAPMAGVTTPKLVINVIKAGGFGMLAAGDVKPQVLERWIDEVKNETTQSFGVNFFVPRRFSVTDEEFKQAAKLFRPLYDSAGIRMDLNTPAVYEDVEKNFFNQVKTALNKGIKVFSFIFGVPPESVREDIKNAGGTIIATATTADEAAVLEECGADIIVAQGKAAGGHRGSFLKSVRDSFVETYDLVAQIKEDSQLPVIAAGGIMTGVDIKKLMTISDGVQLGTAFIPCAESGASNIHKETVLSGKGETKLTTAFTGREARAVRNKIMDEIENINAVVEYPVQRGLTGGLQQYGKDMHKKEYAMMLAGENFTESRNLTVGELIKVLVDEAGGSL
ncbi:NAD(P)H-dependent flavin oxidoreductase [Corticicoccus populi]|uniref:Probable nitronate monooxygenase n=1 Tax=Corticicoccus populi TaxID=1812821 RepID=A0ABW5WXK7_9STAP